MNILRGLGLRLGLLKMDNKKAVIDYIKNSKPRSSGHKVVSNDEFLNGVIAKVEYTDDVNDVKQYVIITKKHSSYADTESQLIQQMNVAASKNSSGLDWLNQIFNIGGIIALILVGTASYISLNNPSSEIPEYLKTALLTVIGFYFGGYVSQSIRKKNKENG